MAYINNYSNKSFDILVIIIIFAAHYVYTAQ